MCWPALGVLLAFTAVAHAADLPGSSTNGWHTWRVPVVEDGPELCCFRWNSGSASQKHCNLDDGRGSGFATSNDGRFPADEIQIYAWMDAGTATKIRVLSAQCPVTSQSEITDLGVTEANASIEWLQPYVTGRSATSNDAIIAVALHAGDQARRLLIQTANGDTHNSTASANWDTHKDIRETAVFWMGQARIEETAADLRNIMFGDQMPDIREHAAFSYSQSTASDRTEVLIRQGNEDPDPGVRSQAWFWLAQTEAPESDRAMLAALVSDNEAEVREGLVFALSQLPEKRSVDALTGILDDHKVPLETREQALFWLAQSESDAAFEYVERLLTEK